MLLTSDRPVRPLLLKTHTKRGSGMKWRCLLAVLLGLSIYNEASFAQRPPGDQRLVSRPSSSEPDEFFSNSGMARFQLVSGRIQLDAPRHRKGSQQSESNGQFESLTVASNRGLPSLHYIYKTESQQITLDVHEATRIKIDSIRPQTNERSVLVQNATDSIVWTIDRGELKDHYHGESLLHLYGSNPSSFELHYGELTTRMLRGRSIDAVFQSTIDAMLDVAMDRGSTFQIDEITQHIEQLGSKHRKDRMIAHRKLLSLGSPAIPLLRCAIASGNLDDEQTGRISDILERCRAFEDTPGPWRCSYRAIEVSGIPYDQLSAPSNGPSRITI